MPDVSCECVCGNNTFHIYRTIQVNGNDDTYTFECASCGKEIGIGNMIIEDEL